MINQQLLDFIKSQLSKGVDKEIITKELLGKGWTQLDIEDIYKIIDNPLNPKTAETSIISSEKTNRLKFYFILIIISIGVYFTSVLFFAAGPMIIPPISALISAIVILIAMIYEANHSFTSNYSLIEKNRIYKIFILISILILIWVIPKILIYFKDIFNNYDNLKGLETIKTRNYVSNEMSLSYLLTNINVVLKYILIISSSFLLVLSIKKREISKFALLISILIVFLINNKGTALSQEVDMQNITSDSKNNLILDKAYETKDVKLCATVDREYFQTCISNFTNDSFSESMSCWKFQNRKDGLECQQKVVNSIN